MSFFVTSTAPPKPKTAKIHTISLILAGAFVLLAVLQLFTYEDFPAALMALGISEPAARFLASVIVVSEVLALPYLLFMRLSLLMRALSMVSGWIATLVLFIVALWENIGTNLSGMSVVLGSTISVPAGWWSVCLVLGLGILAAWVAWGMWPKFSTKK